MTSPAHDTALLTAWRDGDGHAFGALVERHRGPLMGFLGRRVGQDAEELHQEVWTRVARATGIAFPDDARFRAYLYTTARHLVVDHHRRRSARPELVFPELPAQGAVVPTVESSIAWQRLWADVHAALDKLSPPTAEVVRLRLVEDLSFAQIAQRQGAPLNTVLGRMHRGLKDLRAALADAGHLPPSSGALP